MQIEYDPDKDAVNRRKHGIPLADALRFEWETAEIKEDARFDQYGEQRFAATGYLGSRLHRLIFFRRGEKTRIISLRKANKREERDYAQAQT